VSFPVRWRLLDMETGAALTDCMDIDGLFVYRVFPVEPLYERYTLLSCAPSGPLLAAIDGTGPVWFGNLVVEDAHVPGRPVSEGCTDQCRERNDIVEELLDVRSSTTGPPWTGPVCSTSTWKAIAATTTTTVVAPSRPLSSAIG